MQKCADMETSLTLEYLKVLTSTQIVWGVVILVLACKFKKEIRNLIDRIAHIKFPGGELSANRPQSSDAESYAKEGQIRPELLPPEEIPELEVSPEERERIKCALDSERVRAALWEYRYLNTFLVYKTQLVLDWIGSQPQKISYAAYDTYWLPYIPNANERNTIVDVLQAHHLIDFTDGLINITPKGAEYINWRGEVKVPS